LLSASDDEPGAGDTGLDHVEFEPAGDIGSAADDDALLLVTDIAEADEAVDEPIEADVSADDATQAMPVVGNGRSGQESDGDEDDFRFSFDDDRH
jgi:hypothetical protein